LGVFPIDWVFQPMGGTGCFPYEIVIPTYGQMSDKRLWDKYSCLYSPLRPSARPTCKFMTANRRLACNRSHSYPADPHLLNILPAMPVSSPAPAIVGVSGFRLALRRPQARRPGPGFAAPANPGGDATESFRTAGCDWAQ
jgi:hypothetical protein